MERHDLWLVAPYTSERFSYHSDVFSIHLVKTLPLCVDLLLFQLQRIGFISFHKVDGKYIAMIGKTPRLS